MPINIITLLRAWVLFAQLTSMSDHAKLQHNNKKRQNC